MLLSRLRRLGSLTLLVTLVGGGLGLPMFDAVVFHGRPLPAPRTTIDGDGGSRTHTQLCVLDEAGLRTPSIRSAGHAPLHAVPASAAPLPDGHSTAGHDALLLPRPRAPPLA